MELSISSVSKIFNHQVIVNFQNKGGLKSFYQNKYYFKNILIQWSNVHSFHVIALTLVFFKPRLLFKTLLFCCFTEKT